MTVIRENEEFIINGSIYKWKKKKGVLTIQLVEALIDKKCHVELNMIGQKPYNFKLTDNGK